MPFIGSAVAFRVARICAGVSVGTSCSIKAATAAALGAAEEVPKKVGRSCWFTGTSEVADAGWPVNSGFEVSTNWPGLKNEVVPPSGAVIVGLSMTCGVMGVPVGLRLTSLGPDELNGSLAKGFCPRYGTGAHHGVAPTPIVAAAAECPKELG